MRRIILLTLLALMLLPSAQAQEVVLDTGVFVTTQDFASVRTAPNGDAERLTVLDPGVTLPAVLRTAGTDWIAVRVEGQVGWIAAFLLVWTGDVSGLPVLDTTVPNVVPVDDPALQAELDTELDKDVFVTTQDNSNLREGPSEAFPVLTVVPADTTLPVIGRSVDSGWLQVIYQGQRGWIVEWLLVSSGEIVELPADGVAPADFVRLGVLGEVGAYRGLPAYVAYNSFEVATTLPYETQMEVIGSANGRYQVRVDGEIYWVNRRAVNIITGGNITFGTRSLTTAPERLTNVLGQDINRGLIALDRIDTIWNRIESGQAVRCDSAPDTLPTRRGSDVDLAREPLFQPVATALEIALGHTNTAIAAFTDVCSRAEPRVTLADVRSAQDEIDAARRNYTLARSLLNALPNF